VTTDGSSVGGSERTHSVFPAFTEKPFAERKMPGFSLVRSEVEVAGMGAANTDIENAKKLKKSDVRVLIGFLS